MPIANLDRAGEATFIFNFTCPRQCTARKNIHIVWCCRDHHEPWPALIRRSVSWRDLPPATCHRTSSLSGAACSPACASMERSSCAFERGGGATAADPCGPSAASPVPSTRLSLDSHPSPFYDGGDKLSRVDPPSDQPTLDGAAGPCTGGDSAARTSGGHVEWGVGDSDAMQCELSGLQLRSSGGAASFSHHPLQFQLSQVVDTGVGRPSSLTSGHPQESSESQLHNGSMAELALGKAEAEVEAPGLIRMDQEPEEDALGEGDGGSVGGCGSTASTAVGRSGAYLQRSSFSPISCMRPTAHLLHSHATPTRRLPRAPELEGCINTAAEILNLVNELGDHGCWVPDVRQKHAACCAPRAHNLAPPSPCGTAAALPCALPR